MSIDVSAAIDLAIADAGEQPIGQTLADVKVLFAVVQQIKSAGKLSCRQLDKAGKFDAFIEAVAREAAVLVKIKADPAHRASLLNITDSLGI